METPFLKGHICLLWQKEEKSILPSIGHESLNSDKAVCTNTVGDENHYFFLFKMHNDVQAGRTWSPKRVVIPTNYLRLSIEHGKLNITAFRCC